MKSFAILANFIGPSSQRTAIITAALISSFPVMAEDASLDLSQAVSIHCETSAVILDSNPFEASKGKVTINLQLDDPAESAGPGRWKISADDGEHKASFVSGVKESCAPDCPFTQGKDGTLQLWSPKPLALSQLDDETALVLATIDKTSLELKASMFRKKEMAGLERGDCTVAGEGAPDAGASSADEAPPTEESESSDAETPEGEAPEKQDP